MTTQKITATITIPEGLTINTDPWTLANGGPPPADVEGTWAFAAHPDEGHALLLDGTLPEVLDKLATYGDNWGAGATYYLLP